MLRTERDLPIAWAAVIVPAVSVFLWLYPGIPVNLPGAVLILVFGFFFASVSARMVGGLVRHIAENRKYRSEDSKKNAIDSGVLYSSGLVAGEGLVGILLAVLAVIKIGGSSLAELINVSGKISLGNIGGAAAYLLLAGSMLLFVFRGAKENKEGLDDER